MFEDMIEKADDSFSGYVGHLVASTQYQTGAPTYKKFYRTYSLEFPRPETGEKRVPHLCRVCGEKLEIMVRSKQAVRRLKIKLRVFGVLGLALGIFLFTRLPRGQLTAWEALQVFVFLFSFFGGLGALAYSVMSYEMSFKLKTKGKTEHKLFETIEDKKVGSIPFG